MSGSSHVRRERMTRMALALAQLMTSLDTSTVNASLPMLARAFRIPFQHAQWIVLANLLTITSFTVSAGRFGDAVGRRRLLPVAVALFVVASGVCAMVPSIGWLLPARAAQGVCAATILALTVAVAGELGPGDTAGRAMGQLAAMSAVGTTLGPVVAGAVSPLGPRAIFMVTVPVGIVAVVLLLRCQTGAEAPRHASPSFDVAGTVLLAATLSAYALAMTRGSGGWSPAALLLLGAAVAGAASFALVESRVAHPLLPVATFRDPALRAGLATSTAVATVVMSTLIVGPFYLSRALGLTPARAGVVLSIGPAAAAVTAALAGRIVQRAGATCSVLAGLVVMGLGAASLAILPRSAGVPGYLGPLVVLTVGYALFQTGNNTGIVTNAAPSRRGVIAGVLTLSRNLGLITGASVMGAVFVHAVGSNAIASAPPDAVSIGMRTTLAVAALLIAAALALTVRTVTSEPGRTSSCVLIPTTLRSHSERT